MELEIIFVCAFLWWISSLLQDQNSDSIHKIRLSKSSSDDSLDPFYFSEKDLKSSFDSKELVSSGLERDSLK